jgi:hypothetical protein
MRWLVEGHLNTRCKIAYNKSLSASLSDGKLNTNPSEIILLVEIRLPSNNIADIFPKIIFMLNPGSFGNKKGLRNTCPCKVYKLIKASASFPSRSMIEFKRYKSLTV